MKKLVWSELQVAGGKPFAGELPQPPSIIGPFQNMPIDRKDYYSGLEPHTPPREVYADVAVVAYRLPEREQTMGELNPRVTNSAGTPVNGALLWDGDVVNALIVPFAPPGEAAWAQVDFTQPRVFYAVSIGLPGAPKAAGELQYSLDGRSFIKIVDVPRTHARMTLSFAPVTARYVRLRMFTPPPLAPTVLTGFIPFKQLKAHQLTELVVYTTPRVHRAEEKAGFSLAQSLDDADTPAVSTELVPHRAQIVDLTGKMRSDGTLRWAPPPGRWSILRFGYSLIGNTNHPAAAEATGLEVDKLSRTHVQANYRHYLDGLGDIVGPELMGAKGLRGLVNDSWEAGFQNWTEALPAEFEHRRGYSLIPWLPALTGRVIGSAAETDRFLWDFRRTLAELLTDNHYRTIAQEVHARGMLHYAESHEPYRAYIGDGMATKRFADVPMGAMWTDGLAKPRDGDADVRESASVARLYGRKFVAAEAFTASSDYYAYVPARLEPVANRALEQGVNRFVIHTSVHQPLNEPGPGMTLGPFGQWFTRHETWAKQAKPWVDYLARSSFLLQQGTAVSDLLYFYGEDTNVTALYGKLKGGVLPAVPHGYNYDFVNAEALALLSVKEGYLTTQSGMRYAMLVLDERTRVMSLSVLKRLDALVRQGATVVGAQPLRTPSLADDAAEFESMAKALWGTDGAKDRRVGRGRVIADMPLTEAITRREVAPDFSCEAQACDGEIGFVHRRLHDGDLYFINYRGSRAMTIQGSFRVQGKAAQLWDAATGKIEPASYRLVGERTVVPLHLEPLQAVFVVFREPAAARERTVATPRRKVLRTLEGPWQVRFAPAQVAAQTVTFPKLSSWSDNSDPAVKYYSGTAMYTRTFDVPSAWLKSSDAIELDLGAVRELAEVQVNGRPLGVLWKKPFRTEITSALRVGSNTLEVRITNTWVNRLIGDKQPGTRAYAYASFDPYKTDSPLLPSGLLGPVSLLEVGATTTSVPRTFSKLNPNP